MIGELVRGKRSVSETFWFGVVGFAVVVIGVGWSLKINIPKIYELYSDAVGDGLLTGYSVAASIGFLVVGLSLYRAMFDYRRPGWFAPFGVAAALVSGIAFGANSFVRVLPGSPITAAELKKRAEVIAATVPFEIEPRLLLRGYGYEEGLLWISYSGSAVEIREGEFNAIQDLGHEDLCLRFAEEMRGPVSRAELRYKYGDARMTIFVTRADCRQIGL